MFLVDMKRSTLSNTPVAGRGSGSKHTMYEQIFCSIDKDGDGMISPTELTEWMPSISKELGEDTMETFLESISGFKFLGFDEFVKLIEGEGEEGRESSLREAFRVYEMEGQGCITAQSLRRVLGTLGECKSIEDCKVIIRRFDSNADGVISYEEFCSMMQ